MSRFPVVENFITVLNGRINSSKDTNRGEYIECSSPRYNELLRGLLIGSTSFVNSETSMGERISELEETYIVEAIGVLIMLSWPVPVRFIGFFGIELFMIWSVQ